MSCWTSTSAGSVSPQPISGFVWIQTRFARAWNASPRRFTSLRQRVRLLVTKEGRATFEARPVPELPAKPPRVVLARAPVDSSNPFLYHKTTNRGLYDGGPGKPSGL